mmetsp:Transcript_9198/g.18734  ORF Transcript_9198/g.18734 Transcript_9198/m.18734 type:complete len:218 (+) Transcript_9198:1703-2356(+)
MACTRLGTAADGRRCDDEGGGSCKCGGGRESTSRSRGDRLPGVRLAERPVAAPRLSKEEQLRALASRDAIAHACRQVRARAGGRRARKRSRVATSVDGPSDSRVGARGVAADRRESAYRAGAHRAWGAEWQQGGHRLLFGRRGPPTYIRQYASPLGRGGRGKGAEERGLSRGDAAPGEHSLLGGLISYHAVCGILLWRPQLSSRHVRKGGAILHAKR